MNKEIGEQKRKFHLDRELALLLILLAVVSCISLYGAVPYADTWKEGMQTFTKQIVWYVIGFALLGFLLFFDIDRLFTGIKVFYWILFGLLVLLILDRWIPIPFVPVINGSRSWFVFPILGSIQPSEFMKSVFILYTSNVIQKHNEEKRSFSYSDDISLFMKILQYTLIPVILIFLQPETGIILIMFVSIISMLAVGGIRREWIWAIVGLVVLSFATILLLYYKYPDILSSLADKFGYRIDRFYGWLDISQYTSANHQLYYGQVAYGTAGWFGYGLQSYVIPISEATNDFIFAVIAQDFGFVGASLTILLCLWLDIKLIRIALHYPKPRERYLVAGVLGMLVFQQFQNIGMVLGVLPITGITLPFISAGGSSLLSYMIPFAVIFHMSSESQERYDFGN